MTKLAKQKLLIRNIIKNRAEYTRIFVPILPDSYCSPIVGTNVAIRHRDVPTPQSESLALSSAMVYARKPINNASMTLIIVRKTLAFIIYTLGNGGGVNAIIFKIFGTSSIGFHPNIPGIHTRLSLVTFCSDTKLENSFSDIGPTGFSSIAT